MVYNSEYELRMVTKKYNKKAIRFCRIVDLYEIAYSDFKVKP